MPVNGTSLSSYRPLMQGSQGAVVASHPAAALAGFDILRRGGNAVDAGVAVGLALNVVHAHECNFLGVAPAVLYHAGRGELVAIDGLGVWPRAATPEFFRDRHGGKMPVGILRALTPGACDTWFTALARYGTMTFGEVAQAAIDLAEKGFPVYRFLLDALREDTPDYTRYDTNAAVFLPGGKLPALGDLFVQKDLAATLRMLVAVEQANAGLGREAALQAARDEIYTGSLGRRIVAHCQALGGLLTMEDMAGYGVRCEAPVHVNYRGYDVYATGPWGQGPVFPQALKILEGFDLKAMGRESAACLHTVNQAINLAFADREGWLGDPAFVDVPIAELLSEAYLAKRRSLIDPDCAWPCLPPAGDPRALKAVRGDGPASAREAVRGADLPGPNGPGTSYYGVIDGAGNIFSCTPSEGAKSGPMVPGTGMSISLRGAQSKLDPAHPACLGPGKRPRLTPAPALVMKDGQPCMAIGGYGGDHIPQGMLQVFLNIVDFGLDPQEAVEAWRAYSYSFPQSTYPYASKPGLMRAEGRIGSEAAEGLRKLGHRLELYPDWWEGACLYGAIVRNPGTGLLQAGADPRGEAYALAY